MRQTMPILELRCQDMLDVGFHYSRNLCSSRLATFFQPGFFPLQYCFVIGDLTVPDLKILEGGSEFGRCGAVLESSYSKPILVLGMLVALRSNL